MASEPLQITLHVAVDKRGHRVTVPETERLPGLEVLPRGLGPAPRPGLSHHAPAWQRSWGKCILMPGHPC